VDHRAWLSPDGGRAAMQAAYESEMSIWGAVMGHANLVKHGAG
jgi:trimethylamine:corrinoid methyltransferase-like protein